MYKKYLAVFGSCQKEGPEARKELGKLYQASISSPPLSSSSSFFSLPCLTLLTCDFFFYGATFAFLLLLLLFSLLLPNRNLTLFDPLLLPPSFLLGPAAFGGPRARTRGNKVSLALKTNTRRDIFVATTSSLERKVIF